MLNISSLINNSHQNSSFGKFGCFEEDSNTIEAGNQNNSMFISYVSGEMKEQTLDKSMNFQIENDLFIMIIKILLMDLNKKNWIYLMILILIIIMLIIQ